MPKFKALPGVPFSNTSPSVSAPPKEEGAQVAADSAKTTDPKSSRYTPMILEALTSIREPNGSEIGAICRFIEQKYEVPSNFRRLLSSKLRRLVAQNKIEKVQNGYKPKDSLGTKTPTPKQKDPLRKPAHNSVVSSPTDPVTEAAISAAYKIADAEAKSFLASEAVKEAEKVARMVEEQESILMLAKEIYDKLFFTSQACAVKS